MKKVVIASSSKNPAKLNAAKGGFAKMFPNEEFEFELVAVESGVSDQPMTDEETLKGAKGRASNAAKAVPSADFWIGLEGGIEEKDGEMASLVWIYIKTKDKEGKGKTGQYYLPKEIVDLIKEGKELGQANDIVFNRLNSKHNEGSIGLLTHGVYDRASYYEIGVVLALVPFANPELY